MNNPLKAFTAKPGQELQSLSSTAKSGLEALDVLVQERNQQALVIENLNKTVDKLTIECEQLMKMNELYQRQRDFWMRSGSKVEAHIEALFATINTLNAELKVQQAEAAKINSAVQFPAQQQVRHDEVSS